MLARGVGDGSLRPDVDPRAEATHVVGTIRGLSYLWALDPDRFDGLGAFDHLTEVLRQRLTV